MGVLAAVGEAFAFKSAISSFSTMQDNLVRLETTVRANGLAVEETMAKYKAFAAEIAATTRVGAGQVTQLLTTAASYDLVGEKAEKAVRLAIGISQGRPGTSPDTVIRALSAFWGAKELSGEEGDTHGINLLSRILLGSRGGIGRGGGAGGKEGAADSQEKLIERINKQLNISLEVSQKLGDTFGGQLARMNNALAGLRTEIGGLLAGQLQPFVQWVTNAVTWFRQLDPIIKTFVLDIVALGGALSIISPSLWAIKAAVTAAFAGLSTIFGLFTAGNIAIIGPIILGIALVVRSLGGMAAAWEWIQEKASTAWVYIKSYTSSFIDWATPYWNTFVETLSKGWDTVYEFAMQAWEGTKTAASNFFTWAWPIFQSLWSLAKTIWEGIQDIAVAAWNEVVDATQNTVKILSELWSLLTENITINWDKIREDIVTAILFIEYTFRNFGKVADVISAGIAYGFVFLFNEIEDFFTSTAPALFTAFKDNWFEILRAMYDGWQATNDAIGEAIITLFSNIGDLITGRKSIADLMGPVIDKFEARFGDAINRISGKIPEIPERAEGDIEKILREEFEKGVAAIGESFDEFKEKKLAEFAEAGFGFPAVEIANAAKGAAKATEGIDLGKPFTQAGKEIKKWEAALYGSSESYSHWFDYIDRLNEWEQKKGSLSPLAGGKKTTEAIAPSAPPTLPEKATPAAGAAAGDTANKVFIDTLTQLFMATFGVGYAQVSRPVTVTNLKVGQGLGG